MTPMRYRRNPWELSPWVRAVMGPHPNEKLPRGYWITGLAKTPSGPYALDLYGPGRVRLAGNVLDNPDDVRPTALGLSDLAWVHERQQGGEA